MDAPAPLISTTTVLSFFLVLVLLFAAYAVSVFHLDSRASGKTRFIYIWHLFDALIHLIFEGSFVYYSLFSSAPVPTSQSPALWGDRSVSYGAKYSSAPLAGLWTEYGRADRRWEEADVGVLSLEILTVIGGGALAAWICFMVARGQERRWFWISVLAVAELYGGWMTFVPEWISGSHSLDTSNPMYTWVYLFFFNTIWVWIPLWLLWEAYWQFIPALEMMGRVEGTIGRLGAVGMGDYSDDEDDSEVEEMVRKYQ
ncbi:Emopamil binding protein-domain-containing protein [Geopyxis carbonaria]|nr:Emopamil binding protein-domain-containing protein [Geopyxis carbonaria]